ncbi:unnamed protein product, partial [Rhizoctonia solani]
LSSPTDLTSTQPPPPPIFECKQQALRRALLSQHSDIRGEQGQRLLVNPPYYTMQNLVGLLHRYIDWYV